MIIVAQVLIGEVVHDVHRTDGHTILVLRAFVNLRHRLFHQTRYGSSSPTGTPLLMDDTTLLVDLLIFQQQVMAPVV